MLSPLLLDTLRLHWKHSRPQHWLFPGYKADKPITTKAVFLLVRKAAARARITKTVSQHVLRHYATSRTMPRSTSTKRPRACGPLRSSHGPVKVMRHSPVASRRARCGSKTGVVGRYGAPKLFLPKAGSPFVPSRSVVQVYRQYQRRPSGHGVRFGNYASSPQSKAPQIGACAFRGGIVRDVA